MNDDSKRIMLIAGLIPGVIVGVLLVIWFVTSVVYIGILLDVLATCAVLALIGRISASVYWAFKAPHSLFERGKNRLAALVKNDGTITILPLPQYPAGLQNLSSHDDQRLRLLLEQWSESVALEKRDSKSAI